MVAPTLQLFKKIVTVSKNKIKIAEAISDADTSIVTKMKLKTAIEDTQSHLKTFETEILPLQPKDIETAGERFGEKAAELLKEMSDLDMKSNCVLVNGITLSKMASTSLNVDSSSDTRKTFQVEAKRYKELVGIAKKRAVEKQLPLLAHDIASSGSKISNQQVFFMKCLTGLKDAPTNSVLKKLVDDSFDQFVNETNSLNQIMISQEGLFSNQELIYGKRN